MSLSLQAFAPAALLLLGSLVLLLRPGATVFAIVEVTTLAALIRLSQLSAATLTVPVYDPLSDVPLVLRLDRLSLFFAISAVFAGLLVALPWVGDRDRRVPFGWLTLAQFGTVGGILSGNLQGLAAGWGVVVAALLMLILVPQPVGRELGRLSGAVTRTVVLHLAGAALVLVGAVVVEALTGTTSYDAVPVGAIDSRTQLLLLAAPVISLATLAGLLRACRRPATAAVLLPAVVLPLAAYTLARTVDLAEGRSLQGSAGLGLVLAAGVGATGYGLYALWAPDLGATIGRLISALGLVLLAAFAVGGSGGLVALLVGYVSLQAVVGALLVLLDAGQGRLPGRGSTAGWLIGLLALLPLAATGGLVLAMGLDARLLVLRRLLDLGLRGALVAVPLLTAVAAVLAGSLAAARFGGGRVSGRRGLIQLGLGGCALVGLQLAGPVVRDLAVSLAAAGARVPLADVRSTASASVPGPAVAGGLLLLAVVVVGIAARPGWYSPVDGLRRAPDMLPPPIAVMPEIVLRRGLLAARSRGSRVAGLAAAHPRWVIALGWLAAVVVVVFAGR